MQSFSGGLNHEVSESIALLSNKGHGSESVAHMTSRFQIITLVILDLRLATMTDHLSTVISAK